MVHLFSPRGNARGGRFLVFGPPARVDPYGAAGPAQAIAPHHESCCEAPQLRGGSFVNEHLGRRRVVAGSLRARSIGHTLRKPLLVFPGKTMANTPRGAHF